LNDFFFTSGFLCLYNATNTHIYIIYIIYIYIYFYIFYILYIHKQSLFPFGLSPLLLSLFLSFLSGSFLCVSLFVCCLLSVCSVLFYFSACIYIYNICIVCIYRYSASFIVALCIYYLWIAEFNRKGT
jgi:hypothetical protein